MSERQWQLSVEAESDSQIQELHRLTASIIKHEYTIAGDIQDAASAIGSIYPRFREQRDVTDRESMHETVKDFLTSDFVQALTPKGLSRIHKAFMLSDDAQWGYGAVNIRGLYGDTEDAALKQEGTTVDSYILSGLVGHDLLGRSKRVDRLIEQIDISPLDRLVLLGGLAVSSANGEYLKESSVSYLGKTRDGIAPITRIGADFHGDFRMSRGRRFISDATDPLGGKRPFAPIIPETLVAMYHSTEPQMLATILFYHSKKVGISVMSDMYQRIVKRLETSSFQGNGRDMFGDYGDDSGRGDADNLKLRLANENEDFTYLDSSIVKPRNFELALRIQSSSDGKEFNYVGTEAESMESVIIPDNEIEDFIVTLFSNCYGRTSPHALFEVVNVFKSPKESDLIDLTTVIE